MTLAQTLNDCSRQLYTLVVQYGSACLLGDKINASSLNGAINESFKSLDSLIVQVAKLEVEQRTHEDILESIEAD
jgi:hypothetical protein